MNFEFTTDTLKLDSATLFIIKSNNLEYLIEYRKNYDSSRNAINKRIEDLEYNFKMLKKCDDFLKEEKWFIGILITLIGIFGVILGLWSTIGLSYSVNNKINEFERVSKEELDKKSESMINEINQLKIDFEKKLVSIKIHTIYQSGVSDYNKGKIETALSYFNKAYKSDHLLEHTTYYLGMCYKKIENYSEALKILTEALEKNEKFPDRKKLIQKEIREIKTKLSKNG